MLSFHVKFVQTDRQTDGHCADRQADRWTTVKQYGGIKMKRLFEMLFIYSMFKILAVIKRKVKETTVKGRM